MFLSIFLPSGLLWVNLLKIAGCILFLVILFYMFIVKFFLQFFIHFSLLCLIFVTQMSEENLSLTDFVCQMTKMKSTVHPKEILLFKNGHQLFNHIYITIHE